MAYQKKKRNYHNFKSEKRDFREGVEKPNYGRINGNAAFAPAMENDPIWWCKFPQLVKDAANLPYSWPTGPDFASATNTTVPALMTLRAQICPGVSRTADSPVNIAARRHYSYMRSANSGAKNYGPQDLIQYFMAMDSVYAMISLLTRIYGVMNLYSAENRFVPRGLARGLQFDYDDMAEHIPDLRAYINLLIYKASSFAVPKDMGLFERHIQLFGNIYADYNNTRAQLYAYVPHALFTWDEANGQLLATNVASIPRTFSQLKTTAESIINPICASEAAAIMSGDIIKACGDNIIKLQAMDEAYKVIPVYSPEILMQIHNTICVGAPTGDVDITQNAAQDQLIYDPKFTFSTNIASLETQVLGGPKLVDMPFDTITPENNMVATRDVVNIQAVPGDATKFRLTSCGTEYIVNYQWYKLDVNGDGVQSAGLTRSVADTTYSAAAMATAVNALAAMSKFDWAPPMWIGYLVSSTPTLSDAFRDVTKYTVISPENVDRLHEVALLSAFVSPAVAETSALR